MISSLLYYFIKIYTVSIILIVIYKHGKKYADNINKNR